MLNPVTYGETWEVLGKTARKPYLPNECMATELKQPLEGGVAALETEEVNKTYKA